MRRCTGTWSLLMPISAPLAACRMARSAPLAVLGARPSTSHDSLSVSATGGLETSSTRGASTLPVTCTPASTAWWRRQAVMSIAGRSSGPSKISAPGSTSSSCP